MPELPDTEVTLAEIARIAGVGRAAVSNWRRRHSTFPSRVSGTDSSPLFSLSAVEAMASTLWPQALSVAVSIPDPRKGERIVLLTTQKDADRASMQRQAKAVGASELAVSATIQVVDKVPLLGSGKTDYVAATALAKETAGSGEREVA